MAVSAFYDNCDSKLPNMKRNAHAITPFQGLVAKPPNRLCSALSAPLRVASEEVIAIIAKRDLIVKVVPAGSRRIAPTIQRRKTA